MSALWLFLAAPSAAGAEPAKSRQALVRWVLDGDTFELVSGERVRLIGIDAPEYSPWKGRVEAYGKEAADLARTLLAGQTVRLESDVEKKDKYGRTLAYAYLGNGEFVNRRLVEEGLARVRYYRPNRRHYGLLKNSEVRAKRNKKGMWAC